MGGDADQETPGGHPQIPRAPDRTPTRARAHVDAGSRQADSPVAQRAQWPDRQDRLLPGRDRACAARRESLCRPGWQDGGAHRPRAAGRRREHLGVELSVFRRRQRVRARARGRQRGALQAVGVRHADRPAYRRSSALGGRARRRIHRGHRRRQDRHRFAAATRRRRLLHRLVWHRREDRRQHRPADDQDAARIGRQGSDLRVRRRRRAGRGSGGRRRRVLQHRAIVLLGRTRLCPRPDLRCVRHGVRRRSQRVQTSAIR